MSRSSVIDLELSYGKQNCNYDLILIKIKQIRINPFTIHSKELDE